MATTTTKPAFQSFVPSTESRPEFTVRAILLGAIFGILFGAVTVYVGLRAGLTVAASIPISVLSISILRAFGRASILENNIVQSTGNAGQSIASGVIFTLPALIFLGFDLESSRIFALALFGGWLGVLFMIPLRRQLIVQEHGTLPYPEGTACADVLMAGERGGSFASRVFLGLGLGGIYTLFQNDNLFSLFPSTPNYSFNVGEQHLLKGGAIRADVTPEYLGVGYIIGMRVAAVMLAGGVFSWLVLMPAIYFFGSRLSTPLYPGTTLIRDMSPSDLWITYVRPMGAGAVACSGLITLLRTAPTILAALTEGLKSIGKNKRATDPGAPGSTTKSANLGSSATTASGQPPRTEHDLPWSVVIGGSVLLVVLLWVFLEFKPVPGAQVGAFANLAASLLVVVFGFLFVTVSARIVGIVGSSASPVSGMTIATLMATAAIFLVRGWTAPAFGALAITVGGIVCIAASNAGDTAQDLKTGYLIGATPWKQQLAIMIGVIISVLSIGVTLNAMNKGLESFQRMPRPVALSLSHLPDGVQAQGNFNRDHIVLSHTENQGAPSSTPKPGSPDSSLSGVEKAAKVGLQDSSAEITNARSYILLNAIGSSTLADGKYLYNPATGQIEIQWTQGIGSENAAAPQGRLMATVINGILSRKLPWSLVLLGVALVIMVELLGVRSLTLAVGAYLSIGTTLAIFAGGVMRWLVDRAAEKQYEREAASELEASLALWQSDRDAWLTQHPDFNPTNPAHLEKETGLPARSFCIRDPEVESEISSGSLFASGLIAAGGIVGLVGVGVKLYESATDRTIPRFSDHNLLHHDWVSVLMFALLAWSLYYFARKPLDQPR
ncbi:OPT family oligopeptide transporter [Edaphobacter sp. 12200R-103]|uniref:OPT family oligopeptide transporter n=1 Tax=Edaphobacter sp. 12200R-103 TaxID=2703788 RepID=UPI00138B53D8|nr:oligopeptide transporter, OPT family [Edaphobacter sp. 12200R-103]QHS53004.1 oligopeptide transporter, OPT family [Edaphobacter sp. 12200R-103]